MSDFEEYEHSPGEMDSTYESIHCAQEPRCQYPVWPHRKPTCPEPQQHGESRFCKGHTKLCELEGLIQSIRDNDQEGIEMCLEDLGLRREDLKRVELLKAA